MDRLVMKFGGTSVADLDRIRRVARLTAAEVRSGKAVAVVVSAMAGRTNELVAWTDQAGPAAAGLPVSDDEYDMVVSSGEQVTAGLLAMVLRNMGLPARSWMGWQIRSAPTARMAAPESRMSGRWRWPPAWTLAKWR
jgi:aspartate kinase